MQDSTRQRIRQQLSPRFTSDGRDLVFEYSNLTEASRGWGDVARAAALVARRSHAKKGPPTFASVKSRTLALPQSAELSSMPNEATKSFRAESQATREHLKRVESHIIQYTDDSRPFLNGSRPSEVQSIQHAMAKAPKCKTAVVYRGMILKAAVVDKLLRKSTVKFTNPLNSFSASHLVASQYATEHTWGAGHKKHDEFGVVIALTHKRGVNIAATHVEYGFYEVLLPNTKIRITSRKRLPDGNVLIEASEI